ncbi:MAG: winged helix-turn-helix domain-containing protein [Candidatus Nanopelagicales bacterium]|nr:winged helix-turn-helix domain-containing protein [Candidatus Nanopelagicales bacterium]
MKSPQLLPLLRSQTQGDLLALLFLHPQQEYSLTEIARRIGVSTSGVHHEVTRLLDAGFVADRRVGNTRLVRANASTVVAEPLTQLLAVTYGPLPVLHDLLVDEPLVDEAFIYGSWAARYLGVPGPVPEDVDVLVVGTADADRLDDIASAASEVLHRDVSIRRARRDAWALARAGDGSQPFLSTVAQGPRVLLDVGALDAATEGER